VLADLILEITYYSGALFLRHLSRITKMNIWTKLSGSAAFAVLLIGSSDIAVRAQNALVTVNSQGMSESTAVRVGCGISAPAFADAVVSAAYYQGAELFTMPNIVGFMAGVAICTTAVMLLPEPLRGNCIRLIKNITKFTVSTTKWLIKLLFHFNTCFLIASAMFDGYTTMAAFSMAISILIERNFWKEFFLSFALPFNARAARKRQIAEVRAALQRQFDAEGETTEQAKELCLSR
jgi:hypothetical protein